MYIVRTSTLVRLGRRRWSLEVLGYGIINARDAINERTVRVCHRRHRRGADFVNIDTGDRAMFAEMRTHLRCPRCRRVYTVHPGTEVYAEPEAVTALVLAGMSFSSIRCVKCINIEADERHLRELSDSAGV